MSVTINGHDDPMKKIVATSHSKEYKSLKNLDQAKKTKNAYVVMQGDDGGQIYLVCPVIKVACGEADLRLLLETIDNAAWKDMSMAGLYYEIYQPNSKVTGGLGGGSATNDLWIHPNLEKMRPEIQAMLQKAA